MDTQKQAATALSQFTCNTHTTKAVCSGDDNCAWTPTTIEVLEDQVSRPSACGLDEVGGYCAAGRGGTFSGVSWKGRSPGTPSLEAVGIALAVTGPHVLARPVSGVYGVGTPVEVVCGPDPRSVDVQTPNPMLDHVGGNGSLGQGLPQDVDHSHGF